MLSMPMLSVHWGAPLKRADTEHKMDIFQELSRSVHGARRAANVLALYLSEANVRRRCRKYSFINHDVTHRSCLSCRGVDMP